jgi:hypothetical protein
MPSRYRHYRRARSRSVFLSALGVLGILLFGAFPAGSFAKNASTTRASRAAQTSHFKQVPSHASRVGWSHTLHHDVTRTLTLTPATNVGNQVIKASWTGFDPSDALGDFAVWLYQCKANPATLNDCYTVNPFPDAANGNANLSGVTAADGTGSAFIEMRDGAALPDLGCSSASPCSVIAIELDGNPFPTDKLPTLSVVTPVEFAKNAADCPIPKSFDMRSEGEASAAQQFYTWAAQLCTGANSLILDYTETSSNAGRQDMLAEQVDNALTSLGATPDELKTDQVKLPIAYAPVDLNGIALAYNIDDPTTGQQITDLTLSARLVARLLTDTDLLDFFNDPEFLALNPGHHWPTLGVSQPLLRAEINADSRILTEWVAQDTDAKNFIAGNDKYHIPVNSIFKNYPYPVDRFEASSNDTGFVPLTGETQVAEHVFYAVKPADAVVTRPTAQGFIGVIDRPTAQQFALPMAKIVNAAGKPVAPTDDALIAAYHSMTNVNGVLQANFTATDPAVYPLSKLDYVMLRTTVSKVDSTGKRVADAPLADAEKRFLQYAVGDGQKVLLGGVVPLPSDAVAQTQKIAASIEPLGTVHEKGTTTTSSPSGTTTPTTSFTSSGDNSGGFSGSGGGSTSGNSSGTGGGSPPASSDSSTPKPGKLAASKPTTPDSPDAPRWLPVSSITKEPARLAIPGLLALGLIAAISRFGWLGYKRYQKMKLGRAGGSA